MPLPPATLATSSIVPSASVAARTAASTSASSATSARTATARRPRPSISATTLSRSSWVAVVCPGASV